MHFLPRISSRENSSTDARACTFHMHEHEDRTIHKQNSDTSRSERSIAIVSNEKILRRAVHGLQLGKTGRDPGVHQVTYKLKQTAVSNQMYTSLSITISGAPFFQEPSLALPISKSSCAGRPINLPIFTSNDSTVLHKKKPPGPITIWPQAN
jgi:hypothetical protein